MRACASDGLPCSRSAGAGPFDLPGVGRDRPARHGSDRSPLASRAPASLLGRHPRRAGTARAIRTPRLPTPFRLEPAGGAPFTDIGHDRVPWRFRLGLIVRLDRPPWRPDPALATAITSGSLRTIGATGTIPRCFAHSVSPRQPAGSGWRPPSSSPRVVERPPPGEVGGGVDASDVVATDGARACPSPGRPWRPGRAPPVARLLVVYRALPIPDGTAKGLAKASPCLTNLPGYRVVGRRTETWSGLEAARVDAVAPGTGDSRPPGSGRRSPTRGGPWSPRGR